MLNKFLIILIVLGSFINLVGCMTTDQPPDGFTKMEGTEIKSSEKELTEKSIKLLNDKKYFAIVVTNQSGIGRGYYTEGDLNKLHDYFQKLLLKRSAKIDKFYYCPYHETGGLGKYKKKSFYRKPNPGMLFQAIQDFNLDKKKCFMIGDKLTDKQAANKAGIKFYYKKSNKKYWTSKMNILGFIGGSGIYKLEFLTDIKEHQIKSSFGDPSGPIIEGKIDNNTVYFLSRHGEGHTLSPSSINYCA